MAVLTEDQQREILGGDGVNGLCYFNALSYLNSQVGGCAPSGGAVEYYFLSYAQSYGMPEAVNMSNYNNADAFLNKYFDASTLSTSNLSAYFSQGGNYVMTTYATGISYNGGQEHHVIVLTGFNSSKGEYTYVDPTNSSNNGTIPVSQLNPNFLRGVTGCCSY